MLSCKELVKKVNAPDDLTRFKKLEIRIHLLLCKHCANYVKHLKIMKRRFGALFLKIQEVDSEHVKKVEDKTIQGFQKAHHQGSSSTPSSEDV